MNNSYHCPICHHWHVNPSECVGSAINNATGGNADAPSTAATMAVMGQQLTDENAHLRAILSDKEVLE